MKTCTKCHITQPLSEFNKSKKGKLGLSSYCKACIRLKAIENKEQIKEYRRKYYTENKERLNEISTQYAISHKEETALYKKTYSLENKEKIKQYRADYYIENKTSITVKNNLYVSKNKDRITEYKKIYFQKNKELLYAKGEIWRNTEQGKISILSYRHTRRSRKTSTEDGSVTAQTLRELMASQNNKCHYCDCILDTSIKNSVHLDHYIPLSKGGTHTLYNIVYSCMSCNLKKSNTVPTTLLLV